MSYIFVITYVIYMIASISGSPGAIGQVMWDDMWSHNVYNTKLVLLYWTCYSICTNVEHQLGWGNCSDPHYIYSDGQTSLASLKHLPRSMYNIWMHIPEDTCPFAMCFSFYCCEWLAGPMYLPRSLTFIFIWPAVHDWSETFTNIHVPYIESYIEA